MDLGKTNCPDTVSEMSSDSEVAQYFRGPGIEKQDKSDGMQAVNMIALLKEKIAFLSGGRDKRGGAILTFPARPSQPSDPKSDQVRYDDLKTLVMYLASVPSDDVKKLGFTVIIDMRGSTWHNVKPILRVLQECFPHNIHTAYIIKPEKFWEKQKNKSW